MNHPSTAPPAGLAARDAARPPLRPTISLYRVDDLAESMPIEAFVAGRCHIRRASVRIDDVEPLLLLPPRAEIRLTLQSARKHVVVAELPSEVLLRIWVEAGQTHLLAVGTSISDVDAILDRICEFLAQRVQQDAEADAVRFVFWAQEGDWGRQVTTPAWNEIAGHYTRRTADMIQPLMTTTRIQPHAGRLILWHGAPGTGKTTAVRALAREWAPWCAAHYVMDPERLFADPKYLMKVANEAALRATDDHSWQLLIAEDCDEYLRADAKSRAGASLGRLLNLGDGLLGEGLQTVVLLTTNEPIDRLHPAITRPGRCLNQTEFLPLSPEEARAWLGDVDAPKPEGPITLAELFAIRDQRPPSSVAPDQAPGGYL